MTRAEMKKLKSGNRMLRRHKDKIIAIAMVLGGLLTGIITNDSTALVVIMFFVAPLFLTARNIYTK